MTALLISACVLLGFAALFVVLAHGAPSAEDLWGTNDPEADDHRGDRTYLPRAQVTN